MAKIVRDGSRIDLPGPLGLNGVVRELVGWGFKVHLPGLITQVEPPVVIMVTFKSEKSPEGAHFELTYKVAADVASRIVEDILEKIE